MKFADIADRARRIAAQNFPGVPFRTVCSLVYSRTLDDGRHEYKCSYCEDIQIVEELLGRIENRVCRGT
jgi:hypothetical protein